MKTQTRIQREKTEAILDAALDVFSRHGFSGATIDSIAETAGLSKPNLLYYYASKEAMYRALLARLLDRWLQPLQELDPAGDPLDEIRAYVRRKVEMARDMPRESRLFANEIIRGAPEILLTLRGPLKDLVDEKASLIADWVSAGKLAPHDPHHLIFAIWATTQHYADFDVQVRAILGPRSDSRFSDGADFLETLFRSALMPPKGI